MPAALGNGGSTPIRSMSSSIIAAKLQDTDILDLQLDD